MNSTTVAAPNSLMQERVYAFIKEAITTSRFQPGQRLRAAEIGDLTHASRTPVREALSRLEQEGLVRREGGWGYIVNEVSVKDILDLFSVREALEVQAAAEAVPNLNEDAVEQLASLNRKAEEFFADRRFDEFLEQNRRFYIFLAQVTGNALLQQMLGMIHDRVRQVGALIVNMHEPRAQELLTENRQIMTAIRARDAETLVSAVRAHIRRGREHVLHLLQSRGVKAVTLPVPSRPVSKSNAGSQR
jgi:DNA-binding GntR family transcriptional regulator